MNNPARMIESINHQQQDIGLRCVQTTVMEWLLDMREPIDDGLAPVNGMPGSVLNQAVRWARDVCASLLTEEFNSAVALSGGNRAICCGLAAAGRLLLSHKSPHTWIVVRRLPVLSVPADAACYSVEHKPILTPYVCQWGV
jgi:hypothetical protein